MKPKVRIIGLFLVFCGLIMLGTIGDLKGGNASRETIIFNVSPELTDLTNSLASEYQRDNSGFKFAINTITQKANLNSEPGSFFVMKEEQFQKVADMAGWYAIVGRDIVVPVVSSRNPYLNELNRHGITPEKLKQLFCASATWTNVSGLIPAEPIHVFTSNDQIINSLISGWARVDRVGQVNSIDSKTVLENVRNDPYAIGFCKLSQIVDPDGNELLTGIQFLPIDKNSNGKIDYVENIYSSLSSFIRGVWIGKYLKDLSSALYVVSSGTPRNKSEIDFWKWVVTNGQQEIEANGFSSLIYNEQLAQLAKLDEPQLLTNIPTEQTNSMMSVLLLVLVLIILGGVCVELVFRFFYKNDRRKIVLPEAIEAFSEEVVVVPMGLYFDKSHSWAFRRKDGTIRVGVDDFLQHLTGKITKVEMKEPGIKIRKGDHLCSIIRKGKVLHVYSPITGTILEVNEKLKLNSGLLNSGPYSDGWIYVIEPVNWELELQYLIVAERFKANLKDEFQRFKDFMDSAIKSISPDFACSILQDGGSFVDHPLAELGPDVWDDFQTKFIDAAK